jgi:hypothetical protein
MYLTHALYFLAIGGGIYICCTLVYPRLGDTPAMSSLVTAGIIAILFLFVALITGLIHAANYNSCHKDFLSDWALGPGGSCLFIWLASKSSDTVEPTK